ncbi:MAG: HNH endonuclease [Frankiales bacterium]|nr:MAG: HNH endonuclease [Frankiales bacterium]
MGGGSMTEVVDAPAFWLTAGDPGPLPGLPLESPCEGWCPCAVGESSAAAPDGFWATPGVTPPPAGPSRLVSDLRSAVDALAAHGAVSGSRVDTGTLLELAERVRGLALRELAEMEAVGGHARPGDPTTVATWLRDTQNLTDSAARAGVSLATSLRDDLPHIGDLLVGGHITREHAAAVVAGVRGLDRDVVREAEQGLGALAQVTDPVDLRKRLRDKAAAIDDRIAAEAERRARERMGLQLSDVGAHTSVDGTLAGDDGATVRLAMDLAIEASRAAGDKRGKAARRADVLVEWARDHLARVHGRGDSLADDAHTVRTHTHVVCTPEQLAAAGTADAGPPTLTDLLDRDLAGGAPAAAGIAGDRGTLSRGALRRLACDGLIDLVAIQEGRRADPLYVGRAARIVSRELWRALITRDRTCVVKGCHRPPAQCEAHHVKHWADGGLTDLTNCVLLCHQHHHDHHDRGMTLTHRDGRRLTERGWAHAPP